MLASVSVLPRQAAGQPQGKKKAPPTQVRTVTMATGLWHPWSLAFLPNGDGKLRLVRDGRLDPEPLAGVPPVHSVRLSGLMEIVPHPQFAQNHLVYLTYTKDVAKDLVATTLARGRLEDRELVDVKDLLVCDPWAGDGGSGSRLAFGRDGMLYMTTGASNGNAAQEPGSLRGKVLRLRDDGTPAPGNPFEGRAGYKAEIFTIGHRNSLGLALNPVTGEMWNNENGPYGGDEINILKPGANYGWPKVSFGREYSGPKIPNFGEGMTGPVVFWAPSRSHPRGWPFIPAIVFRSGRITSSWARCWAARHRAIHTSSASFSIRAGTRSRGNRCSQNCGSEFATSAKGLTGCFTCSPMRRTAP
jgi:aldose sugar dehydrogenase